jgi:hypothetical protein
VNDRPRRYRDDDDEEDDLSPYASRPSRRRRREKEGDGSGLIIAVIVVRSVLHLLNLVGVVLLQQEAMDPARRTGQWIGATLGLVIGVLVSVGLWRRSRACYIIAIIGSCFACLANGVMMFTADDTETAVGAAIVIVAEIALLVMLALPGVRNQMRS